MCGLHYSRRYIMKSVEENEELKKTIAKELEVEDPSEETAKGIINEARSVRDLLKSNIKNNNILRVSGS